MSFSTEVKDQLTRINHAKACCRQTEFLAFLRMSGNINLGAGGLVGISANTTNPAVARRFFRLAKELWDLNAEIMVHKNNKLQKNNIFTLRIPPQDGVKQVLDLLSRMPDGNPWSTGKGLDDMDGLQGVFQGECCYRAYLRGAFLGNGFINHPKKSYHLEMVCQSMAHAQLIMALMQVYGMGPKINERKSQLVVYLKESEQISDFLNVIGAHNALLELENVKIYKEQKNIANRKANCDEANTDKVVDTGVRQNQAIRLIMDRMGLDKLPPTLREVAYLRLEYPETSLKELGEMLDPVLSKSGINHRLRKLEKIAEEIRR